MQKKKNVTEKLKFVFGSVENIVRKEENAGYQHFPLFPPCFQKPSYTGSLKVVLAWQRDKQHKTNHLTHHNFSIWNKGLSYAGFITVSIKAVHIQNYSITQPGYFCSYPTVSIITRRLPRNYTQNL